MFRLDAWGNRDVKDLKSALCRGPPYFALSGSLLFKGSLLVPAMPWVFVGVACAGGFLMHEKKKNAYSFSTGPSIPRRPSAILCHRNAIATKLRRIVCGYPSCPNPHGVPEPSSGARSRFGALERCSFRRSLPLAPWSERRSAPAHRAPELGASGPALGVAIP